MRIIAGRAKGHRLKTVKGRSIRPMLDRVKESLFNVIQARLPGAAVLDLFAGSGSIGLEALSRGARRCTFVELAPAHVQVLEENLAATGLAAGAQVEVLRRDVLRAIPELARRGEAYDVVFVDPPYGQGLVPPVLAALGAGPLVAPGGLVVAHHHHKEPVPDQAGDLRLVRRMQYGEIALSLYARSGDAAGGPPEAAAAPGDGAQAPATRGVR